MGRGVVSDGFSAMGPDVSYLLPLTPLPCTTYRMPCVALTHNEARILPEFLAHYRNLGVDRFFIVDDRSTDGSADLLRTHPDVTLFAPVEGSSYARDKRFWRSELLDRFSDGRWVVVPDVDEHLVFCDCESIGLDSLVAELEAEGAEALHAVMVDMYRDTPMDRQIHDGPTLMDSFPLFDGPDHYYRIGAPVNFRKKYPVPHSMVIGGMRQRMFEPFGLTAGSPELRVLRTACDIDGPMSGGLAFRVTTGLARLRLRRLLRKTKLYNCSKLPLVRWRRGITYFGGAHAISTPLPLSRHRAALLHFKFAGGVAASRYAAARGQHAGGAELYKRMVDQIDAAPSPLFEGSLRYHSNVSLLRLLS